MQKLLTNQRFSHHNFTNNNCSNISLFSGSNLLITNRKMDGANSLWQKWCNYKFRLSIKLSPTSFSYVIHQDQAVRLIMSKMDGPDIWSQQWPMNNWIVNHMCIHGVNEPWLDPSNLPLNILQLDLYWDPNTCVIYIYTSRSWHWNLQVWNPNYQNLDLNFIQNHAVDPRIDLN